MSEPQGYQDLGRIDLPLPPQDKVVGLQGPIVLDHC